MIFNYFLLNYLKSSCMSTCIISKTNKVYTFLDSARVIMNSCFGNNEHSIFIYIVDY